MRRHFVLLELSPGEGGEGALVTEELLTLRVVLALLLELPVLGPHVLEEGGFPSGPVVTFITLQPLLLVLRRCVGFQVTQVVGPVLTLAAGKDVLAGVELLEVSHTELVRGKLPVTERTLKSLARLARLTFALMVFIIGTISTTDHLDLNIIFLVTNFAVLLNLLFVVSLEVTESTIEFQDLRMKTFKMMGKI